MLVLISEHLLSRARQRAVLSYVKRAEPPKRLSTQRIPLKQVNKLVLKSLKPLKDGAGALLNFQRPRHALEKRDGL